MAGRRAQPRIKPQRIAVLYSSVGPDATLPEKIREAEDLTANAQAIQDTLEKLGHEARCFDFGSDVPDLIARLRRFRPHLVFNLAEAPLGSYAKEPHTVSLLELLGFPYTGNGPLPLAICKDKSLAKKLLIENGIPTPRFCVHTTVPRHRTELTFPLIVKPMRQDGSQGITEESVVENEAALRRSVAYVLKDQRQEALVEEFVGGREFNVPILGNGDAVHPYLVFPPGELVYHSPRWRLCTFDAKWDEAHPSYAAVEAVYPALISRKLRQRLAELTVACARVFQLTGYSRVDLRLDGRGEPQVLDVNPNPDIGPRMGMGRAAETAGLSYPEFIQEIVRLALARGVQ